MLNTETLPSMEYALFIMQEHVTGMNCQQKWKNPHVYLTSKQSLKIISYPVINRTLFTLSNIKLLSWYELYIVIYLSLFPCIFLPFIYSFHINFVNLVNFSCSLELSSSILWKSFPTFSHYLNCLSFRFTIFLTLKILDENESETLNLSWCST